MKSVDTLAAIYAEVPVVTCRGKCADACGPVPAAVLERRALREAGHRLGFHPEQGTCSVLSDDGRCMAYEQRPLICRLYGTAEGLLCPHGCRPERILTRPEVGALIQRVRAVAGEPVMPVPLARGAA